MDELMTIQINPTQFTENLHNQTYNDMRYY